MIINRINYLNLNQADIKKNISTPKKLYCESKSNTYVLPKISFKSLKQIEIKNPYEKGFEDIKLNSMGKIENSGKYLVINKPEDLKAIAKSPKALNNYYILTNDIDFNNETITPIGSIHKPFTGVFDGNGFAIKNFNIKNSNNDVGLFTSMDGARIVNLNLKNVKVSGIQDVGALVGQAQRTLFENCSVEGCVEGSNCVGGLIGVGEVNQIENCSYKGNIFANKTNLNTPLFNSEEHSQEFNYFGGIVGFDEGSKIKGAYVKANIKAPTELGGIVGFSANSMATSVKDSYFEGELITEENKGAILGTANEGLIENCFSLRYRLLGLGTATLRNCFTSLSEIKFNQSQNWDSSIWHVAHNMLPRMKVAKLNEKTSEVYLEDINNSRLIGDIPNSGIIYEPPAEVEIELDIKPPKHYSKNDEILKQIKESTDKSFLFDKFDKYSEPCYVYSNCINSDEVDEILLELVKNKYLPVNDIYTNCFRESNSCTPLYISSRFNKPYVFREMLKRDDIDLYKQCGIYGTTNIFDTMLSYPEDASAYVFYESKNPLVEEYIQNMTAKYEKSGYSFINRSKLLQQLIKMHPNVPILDEERGSVKIPREYFSEFAGNKTFEYNSNNIEMKTLDDVLRNMDVDLKYRDSNGNNFANIVVELDDELEAYSLYKKASALGVDFSNKNYKGFTPFVYLLETGKNQAILADMLKSELNIYQVNSLGENAIHIFTKNPNEQIGIKYLNTAVENGMSVNITDFNGVTALMNAIENKKLNMFKCLINLGANVNITDKNGQTALHYACLNCDNITDLEYIYTLVNQNAATSIKDNNGNTPFDYLSDEMKVIVNSTQKEIDIINSNIQADYQKIKAIFYNQHTEILKDSGIYDTENKNFQFLRNNIIEQRELSLEQILNNLKNSNDKNEITNSLLDFLYILGNDDFELEKEKNILHTLVGTDNPIAKECIEKYCKQFPNKVNEKNESCETPLMNAIDTYEYAQNDFEKLCRLNNIESLISAKADVNLLDDNKQNVMHRICQIDSLILLSKFLDLNTNINQKDLLGKNPIEYLSKDMANKMRNYYENYVISKNLTLGIEKIIKGVKL